MKLSKLLQMLLGLSFVKMGVVEEGSGGVSDGESGEEGKGSDEGEAKGSDEGEAGKGKKQGPTDEEARLLKEVMDKKAAIKKGNETIESLKAQLKQFEGIDVDGVKKMLSEKQAEETRKLEEKGQWESLKKQMVEEFGKEKADLIASLTERNTELSRLGDTIAELTVGNAFASSSTIKDDLTLSPAKIRALHGAHFEFKDGAIVGYDKPAGVASRTVLVDAKGDPLGFEAALQKIVAADPDRDQYSRSKMKQGAGSKTSARAGTPDQKVDQEMSGKDRIAAALAKGALAKK